MRHKKAHSLPVRLTHWVNFFAMIGMVSSGWGIYNADPLFDNFSFPQKATLGEWLGGNIGWHLAIMWFLVANGLLYLIWGFCSGHFKRDFLPVTPASICQDIRRAVTWRLPHKSGHYNAIQKIMYIGVLLLGVLMVLSGLSMWKPVQLSWLAKLMGGFDTARYLHFFGMSGIVLFVVVHVFMVIMVPKTLPAMITGGKKEGDTDA
ncbi:cytochrome b/b6 domain-containing protein [Rouxiella sp. Mn2063]|uniref:cytochrome b/b6 domain-containing protein n=1 Tax=Rouxiella sp. Mn2063 TaxID=3395262 RepID=UPI003BDA57D7